MLEENKVAEVVCKSKIIGNKRERAEKEKSEVPLLEVEQFGENLLEEDRSGKIMSENGRDDRILELLIQIRWSEDDHLNEVEIRFDSRDIWVELVRILNEEGYGPVLDHQVYFRAKHMRTVYKNRATTVLDNVNRAFGACSQCGRIAQFPSVYLNPQRTGCSLPRSASTSRCSPSPSQRSASHSQPSASNSQLMQSNNSDVAERINALINSGDISLHEGLRAGKWLKKHSLIGAPLFTRLTHENLIKVVKEKLYLDPQNIALETGDE